MSGDRVKNPSIGSSSTTAGGLGVVSSDSDTKCRRGKYFSIFLHKITGKSCQILAIYDSSNYCKLKCVVQP